MALAIDQPNVATIINHQNSAFFFFHEMAFIKRSFYAGNPAKELLKDTNGLKGPHR